MHICMRKWSFGIVLWEIATYGKCDVLLCATKNDIVRTINHVLVMRLQPVKQPKVSKALL